MCIFLTVTFMHGCAQWPYFFMLYCSWTSFVSHGHHTNLPLACAPTTSVHPRTLPTIFLGEICLVSASSMACTHCDARTPHLIFQARYLEWEPLNSYLCAFSGAKEFRVFFATNTVPGCLYSRHVEHLHLYAYA